MKNQTLSRERMRKIKMFDVNMEKVEITKKDGTKEVYNISPLPGEYLEDLYFVMNAFRSDSIELPEGAPKKEVDERAKEESDRILKVLGTEASKKLHKLVFASLSLSYPDQDKLLLNRFASQNIMTFIGPVISANMPSNK